MAVPKRKVSKSRRDKRKANWYKIGLIILSFNRKALNLPGQ